MMLEYGQKVRSEWIRFETRIITFKKAFTEGIGRYCVPVGLDWTNLVEVAIPIR